MLATKRVLRRSNITYYITSRRKPYCEGSEKDEKENIF